MGVAEWTRLTLDRIGTNMKLMLERDEDDLLLDEDPIGEFMSRKERMTDLPEDEEEEEAVQKEAVVEPAEGPADGQEAEAAAPVVVNLLRDSEEQEEVMSEPTLAKVEVIEADAEVAEETVTAADIDTSTEDGDAESATATAADEIPLASEAELPEDGPTAEENIAEMLNGLDTTEGEESQQDDDVDSLLDVFKEEQFTDSPISALARGLDDTDVNYLLEEMTWIANSIRGTSTESNQAP